MNKVIVKCNFCGTEFEKLKIRLHDRNFCTKECCGKWNSTNRRININGKLSIIDKERAGYESKND
jgi:hypothetical protein